MMLAKCSSLNSVFFYVPCETKIVISLVSMIFRDIDLLILKTKCTGMYSCWAAGSRISTKTVVHNFNSSKHICRILICGASIDQIFGKYLSIGLLHPIFCVLYELTGINIGWFFWGSKISALQTRLYQGLVHPILFSLQFSFGKEVLLFNVRFDAQFQSWPCASTLHSAFVCYPLKTWPDEYFTNKWLTQLGQPEQCGTSKLRRFFNRSELHCKSVSKIIKIKSSDRQVSPNVRHLVVVHPNKPVNFSDILFLVVLALHDHLVTELSSLSDSVWLRMTAQLIYL